MAGRIKLQIRRYTVLELEGRIRHWNGQAYTEGTYGLVRLSRVATGTTALSLAAALSTVAITLGMSALAWRALRL